MVMKFHGTRYNSLWDWSTWLLLVLVAACFFLPIFLDDDKAWRIVMTITGTVLLALMAIMLRSIYYIIDGNNLVIYQFNRPTALPIDKIESVMPTKTILSSPATSLTNRLAIKFSDRNVLKSYMPIIISPERQEEFIAQLITINPRIKTHRVDKKNEQ